jgi:hypothetical protein
MAEEREEPRVPTVGYHPKKGPQTFHLRRGEKLPEGFSDKPHPGQHENERDGRREEPAKARRKGRHRAAPPLFSQA